MDVSVRQLPAPLQTIDVPTQFAASILGGWGGCVAKLALDSQRLGTRYEPLPGGPAAAKGILAHRVLEGWVKGSDALNANELFSAEYKQLQDELRRDPARAQYVELTEVFGPAEWNAFRAWVVRRCESAGPRGVKQSVTKRSTNGAAASTGVEILLTSSVLRLRGRADRIRRISDDTYEIRDYKTGAVLDEDGEVKENIALQLQAYGLMFVEARPQATVQLCVDNGTELPVAFDKAARAQARESIYKLTSGLPAAGIRTAGDLAKPGPDCLGCRIRHMCSAYLIQAPKWWSAYPKQEDRISNDIWGTVIAVSADLKDVTLADAAGRQVRIDRVGHRHGIDRGQVGRWLTFFDLESSGPSRDFKGQRFHPRVFHELPRDGRERRAWGMQCFEGSAP